MLTSIHWFSPEIYIMITMGTLLAYGAIRPKGFGLTSIILFSNNFTIYSLLVSSLLFLPLLPHSFTSDLLVVNPLVTTIKLFVIASGIVIISLMSRGGANRTIELSGLALLGILGMLIILSANDLIMLYLGLELQSLTMYILAAIKRNGEFSTEAGFKYFILGAVSSGLFLLGAAYIYIVTGHTGYSALADLSLTGISSSIGAILILIALLWKIGAGPLHMWVPDVYEGSPTIVTAYFAIVPKFSLVGTIIMLLTGPFIGLFSSLQNLLIISAFLSLLAGSIGALNQSKLKRLFAYSAISHTGFLLAGLASGSVEGLIATVIYSILYIFMGINTFVVLVNAFPGTSNFNALVTGLARYNLVLALTIAITLLSLAGIPPLAGFISKYWILVATFNSNLFFLTGLAILASVISAFFYLKLIKIMFFKDSGAFSWKVLADLSSKYWLPINQSAAIIMGFSLYVILTALIFPQPIVEIATDAILKTLR